MYAGSFWETLGRPNHDQHLLHIIPPTHSFTNPCDASIPWPGYLLTCCAQLVERLASAKEKLQRAQTPAYLESLQGSLGVDPALYTCEGNNYVV